MKGRVGLKKGCLLKLSELVPLLPHSCPVTGRCLVTFIPIPSASRKQEPCPSLSLFMSLAFFFWFWTLWTDSVPPCSRYVDRGTNLKNQTCGHFSDRGLPSVPYGSTCWAGGKLRVTCQLPNGGSAWEGGLGRIRRILFTELRFSSWGRGGDVDWGRIPCLQHHTWWCCRTDRTGALALEETTGAKKLVTGTSRLVSGEQEPMDGRVDWITDCSDPWDG